MAQIHLRGFMRVETKGRVKALDFAIEVLETRRRYSREPESLLRLLDTATRDIKKLRHGIEAEEVSAKKEAEKRGESRSVANNAAMPEEELRAGTG